MRAILLLLLLSGCAATPYYHWYKSGLAEHAQELNSDSIWHRTLMLHGKPGPGQTLLLEESRVWKEAEKQLEEQRTQENRERYAHAEAPRDPGGT